MSVICTAAVLGALVCGHGAAALPWPAVQTIVFSTLATVQLTYALRHRERG